MNPHLRSYNDDYGCKYIQRISVEGNPAEVRCAIGMFMTYEAIQIMLRDDRWNTSGVTSVFDHFGRSIAPELDGVDVKFLAELQKLHDNQGYWYDYAAIGGDASKERHEYYQQLLQYAKRLDNNQHIEELGDI
jgi:hypothetical protein